MGLSLEVQPKHVNGWLEKKWVVMKYVFVMGLSLPMVTGLGLNWSPAQHIGGEPHCSSKLTTLMGPTHFKIAHLAVSCLNKFLKRKIKSFIHCYFFILFHFFTNLVNSNLKTT